MILIDGMSLCYHAFVELYPFRCPKPCPCHGPSLVLSSPILSLSLSLFAFFFGIHPFPCAVTLTLSQPPSLSTLSVFPVFSAVSFYLTSGTRSYPLRMFRGAFFSFLILLLPCCPLFVCPPFISLTHVCVSKQCKTPSCARTLSKAIWSLELDVPIATWWLYMLSCIAMIVIINAISVTLLSLLCIVTPTTPSTPSPTP